MTPRSSPQYRPRRGPLITIHIPSTRSAAPTLTTGVGVGAGVGAFAGAAVGVCADVPPGVGGAGGGTGVGGAGVGACVGATLSQFSPLKPAWH